MLYVCYTIMMLLQNQSDTSSWGHAEFADMQFHWTILYSYYIVAMSCGKYIRLLTMVDSHIVHVIFCDVPRIIISLVNT